jgi:hypothetical protein
MIQITEQIAGVYALIGALLVISSYVYGCSRTARKYNGQTEYDQQCIEVLEASKNMLEDQVRFWKKHSDGWAEKYKILEKEIEIHMHEVHEEAERPHVPHDDWESRWLHKADNATEQNKESQKTADDLFWESITRMKNNDQ